MTRTGKLRLGIATAGMFVFPIFFAAYMTLALILALKNGDFRMIQSAPMSAVLGLAVLHVVGGLGLLAFYIRLIKSNPDLPEGAQRRWVWLLLLTQGLAMPYYYRKHVLPLEDDPE